MTLICPVTGEQKLLEYIVNKTAATNLLLHLYSNNYTPTDTTTNANLTESVEAGYAVKTLTGTNWTITAPGDVGTATHAEEVFTFSTSASVYGYYVTSTTPTQVLWAERFSGAPFTLPGGGGTIGITPKITLD